MHAGDKTEEKMRIRADGKAECIGVYSGKSRYIPMLGTGWREGFGITLLNAADENIPLTLTLSPRNTWSEEKEEGISACGIKENNIKKQRKGGEETKPVQKNSFKGEKNV